MDYGHESLVAVAFALPEYVGLEDEITHVTVDSQYLEMHGFSPDSLDDRWLRLPRSGIQVGWMHVKRPVHAAFELAIAAQIALDRFTKRASIVGPDSTEDAGISESASVVVCVIPAIDPNAAREQVDGKLDIVTLAHLIVADTVRSIRIATGLPLQDVTYRSLNPIVPSLIGRVEGDDVSWEDGQAIMLQHFMSTVAIIEPLPPDAVDYVRSTFAQWSVGRPAAVIRDHLGRAAALNEQGRYSDAVIAYATTCEVLFDSLLAALLWERGNTPQAAATEWDNSISNRVKRYYASLLGGNWNLNSSPPLARWSSAVVRPRNRIVHTGATVEGAAAEAARLATQELFSFITSLLIKKYSDFPKVVSLFLGRESLHRHAEGEEALTELLRGFEENEGKFEGEFEKWRREWLALLWS
ncbi:hypothetical protein [Gordonia terrae]